MSDSIEKKVDKILWYFESDPTTKRKGLFEQQEINTRDISEMKTNERIRTGKISIISVIFGAIGAIILKLLGVLKLFV